MSYPDRLNKAGTSALQTPFTTSQFPERTSSYISTTFPDKIDRPGTSALLPVTVLPSQPERSSNLVVVVFPDRLDRAVTSALHTAYMAPPTTVPIEIFVFCTGLVDVDGQSYQAIVTNASCEGVVDALANPEEQHFAAAGFSSGFVDTLGSSAPEFTGTPIVLATVQGSAGPSYIFYEPDLEPETIEYVEYEKLNPVLITFFEKEEVVWAAPAKKNLIVAAHPIVQFWAPEGWTTEFTVDREWAIFQSPQKDSALLFTTFKEPGEDTTRLGKALQAIKLSDVNWEPIRQVISVGLDKFSASLGGGTGTYQGTTGLVWFVTIDTNVDRERVLVVFACVQKNAAARRVEAQTFLDSLQRRR